MPSVQEITRKGRAWLGRKGHWVCFPWTVKRVGSQWRVYRIDGSGRVRLHSDVLYNRIQDAMDACPSE